MRDFQGLHGALVPSTDDKLARYLPVLRRDINHLDYFLRDMSQGMGRIQKGEVPDGSGTPIGDATLSDIYLVLKGRSENQAGHGGTSPRGVLTLGSTTDPVKGFIYFGDASAASFDETNTRFGIGTAAATAKAHIVVGAPSFTNTSRASSDIATGGWVNTTGGFPVYPATTASGGAVFARAIEGGSLSSLIMGMGTVSAANTSGWTAGFTGRKTAGAGTCLMAMNLDSGGGSWFNSGNFEMPTTFSAFGPFAIDPLSATAAVLGSTRVGFTAPGAAPGFGEVEITDVYFRVPAAGSIASDTLQKWEAGAASGKLDFGDSGASTVDFQLSGNSPWFVSLGDGSSGLRTYASASAEYLEAGKTDQTNMNLVVAGNRQATGTLLTLKYASTVASGTVQATQVGIGGAPSSSPVIHLDVIGSTRFKADSPATITATVTTLDVGNGTFVRQGAGTPGAWAVRSISNPTDGRMLFLANTSAFSYFLQHESSGGTAANRFHINTGTDHVMSPDDGVFLFYDATLARWRVFEWMNAAGTYSITGLFTWLNTLTIDQDNGGLLLIEANLGSGGGPFVKFRDTGTGNSLLLQAPNLAGSTTLSLPDTTDTLVARNTTETLAQKTLAISCKLICDSILSGGSFVDTGDNTKVFRVITSGSSTGVRSAIAFINTVATTYTAMKDLSGNIPVVGDDPPAVAAGALGKVDLTAQTANIGTTNLSSTPPAGFYEVEVILMCTTSAVGAGTLAVVVGWTDNVGATTNTVITGFILTATGRTTGRALLRVASGDITYAVTVTGIYSTAAYAVYVRVIALG